MNIFNKAYLRRAAASRDVVVTFQCKSRDPYDVARLVIRRVTFSKCSWSATVHRGHRTELRKLSSRNVLRRKCLHDPQKLRASKIWGYVLEHECHNLKMTPHQYQNQEVKLMPDLNCVMHYCSIGIQSYPAPTGQIG